MELFKSQNSVSVKVVKYLNDGTVTLTLSDKRKLRIALEKWSDLGQPLNKSISDKVQKILEQEYCYAIIRKKMIS